jgi:hypothetical protein
VTTTADKPAYSMSAFGEADEHAGAEGSRCLHFAATRLQFAVRGIVGALSHHVRQHRSATPGHRRARAAGQQSEQRSARAHAGLVHVDMRIGLVAGDHGGVARAAVVEVGVHVEGDADRHVGAIARMRRSSSPSPSSCDWRDHRAVQVEQHAVAAAATASQMRRAMCSNARSSTGPLGQALGGDRITTCAPPLRPAR